MTKKKKKKRKKQKNPMLYIKSPRIEPKIEANFNIFGF